MGGSAATAPTYTPEEQKIIDAWENNPGLFAKSTGVTIPDMNLPEYGEHNGILTYFNSDTGKNVTVDLSDYSYRDKKAIHDSLIFYQDGNGNMVYGNRPDSMFRDPLDTGTWTMGEGPTYPEQWSDFTLGGPRDPSTGKFKTSNGWTGGDEGRGTDTLGGEGLTEDLIDDLLNGGGGGTGGNPGGGGGDPFTPPTGGGFVPGGGGTIDWGSPTGTQGINPGYDVEEPFNPWGPMGFENSTNKDFYQNQSANQRIVKLRNVLREQAARQQANNPPETPPAGDPWAWAGGSDQFIPQVGTGSQTAGAGDSSMVMNPSLSWTPGQTTNADLLRTYSHLPAMEPYDIEAWINSQDATGDTNWGTWNPNNGNPNPFVNGNPMVDTLFQNMWAQSGGPVPGEPFVPYGYAAPVNWAAGGEA